MSVANPIAQSVARAVARPVAGLASGGVTAQSILLEKASWFGMYDCGAANVLFQDTGGTTPAGLGDPVRCIKSPNGGPSLTQSSGVPGTVAVDASGKIYIDMPSTAFLTSIASYSVEPGTYVGLATARSVEASVALGGIGFNQANGMLINNVTSACRCSIDIYKSGETPCSIGPWPGNLGINVPGVFSAYIKATTIRAMIDGGTHSPVDADLVVAGAGESYSTNGLQSLEVASTWPQTTTITGCRFAINSNGNGGESTAAQRFYGAIFAKGTFTETEQEVLHRWVRATCGQTRIENYDYDMFIIAGQSNAVGTSGASAYLSAPTPPFGAGVEITENFALRPIRPLMTADFQSYASQGNAWAKFVDKYYALTGRSVCLVNNAYSGKGLLDPAGANGWTAANGKLVERSALRGLQAKSQIEAWGRTATVRGVIWMGGETDGLGFSPDNATYKAALVNLRDRFRTAYSEPTLPLLIVAIDSSSNGSYATGFAAVRQAQIDAASENDGIELIVPYQNYNAAGGLVDALHLNQTSLNDVGDIAATSCAALFT